MEPTIHTRNTSLSATKRSQIVEGYAKLHRFFNGITSGEVFVAVEKEVVSLRVVLHVPKKKTLVATHQDPSFSVALNTVLKQLTTQLKKQRDMIVAHR